MGRSTDRNKQLSSANALFQTYLRAHPEDNSVSQLQTILDPKKDVSIKADLKTQTGDLSFSRKRITKDGDCGYTAFGITREKALVEFKANIDSIQSFLSPVIEESLVNGDFIQYLRERTELLDSDLNYLALALFEKLFEDFATYQSVITAASGSEPVPSDSPALQAIKLHSKNDYVVSAFLDYTVRDKKTFDGWPHPAELQALANIQRKELYIWRFIPSSSFSNVLDTLSLPSGGSVAPYSIGQGVSAEFNTDPYAHFCPTPTENEATFPRIDLLYARGSHFDRLELIEGPSDAKDLSILFNFLIIIINDDENSSLLFPRLELLSNILKTLNVSISNLLPNDETHVANWNTSQQKLRELAKSNYRLVLPITIEILDTPKENELITQEELSKTIEIYLEELSEEATQKDGTIYLFMDWLSSLSEEDALLIPDMIGSLESQDPIKNILRVLAELNASNTQALINIFSSEDEIIQSIIPYLINPRAENFIGNILNYAESLEESTRIFDVLYENKPLHEYWKESKTLLRLRYKLNKDWISSLDKDRIRQLAPHLNHHATIGTGLLEFLVGENPDPEPMEENHDDLTSALSSTSTTAASTSNPPEPPPIPNPPEKPVGENPYRFLGFGGPKTQAVGQFLRLYSPKKK